MVLMVGLFMGLLAGIGKRRVAAAVERRDAEGQACV
jgi:hypothetical protein